MSETKEGAKSAKMSFNLEERTARFGEAVIALAKSVPENVVVSPVLSQLVRAATSVGANYCEANDSESKKDFRHKIAICRKESHEAKHWLRMLAAADHRLRDKAAPLWVEAKELNLYFLQHLPRHQVGAFQISNLSFQSRFEFRNLS